MLSCIRSWVSYNTILNNYTVNKSALERSSTSMFWPSPQQYTSSIYFAGFYLYIETSAPRLASDVARIYSPFISGSNQAPCLVFYYHMFGEHVAYLKVLVEPIEGRKQYIWKTFGNQGDVWHKITIPLPPMQKEYQVKFCKNYFIC